MALTKRGVTLLELLIYTVLFSLVASLVASIYMISARNSRNTAAAYAVSGQADTAIRIIRQDLQETAMASVRVYPSRPAATMVSPREMDEAALQGKFLISEYGVPRWRKNIFYALKGRDLVRWEAALTAAQQDRLPKLAVLPTAPGVNARVIARGIVLPNTTVDNLGDGKYVASEWGGFRMQFVRRAGGEGGAESLSNENPGLNRRGAADNTLLTEVELAISEDVGNPPNFYRIKFRVSPRY